MILYVTNDDFEWKVWCVAPEYIKQFYSLLSSTVAIVALNFSWAVNFL